MGRIVASVTVTNYADPTKTIRCDALVDTGASNLVLPAAWRERLGVFSSSARISVETATQATAEAELCGPARIEIEGFRAVAGEVLFLEMTPTDGRYEPLIGYLVLEACPAAVDMVGRRLVPVKNLDLK